MASSFLVRYDSIGMMGAEEQNLLFKVIESIAEYQQCFYGKSLRFSARDLPCATNRAEFRLL